MTKNPFFSSFIINDETHFLIPIRKMIRNERENIVVWIDFCHIYRTKMIESDKAFKAMALEGYLTGEFCHIHDKGILIAEGVLGIFKTPYDKFQNHGRSIKRAVVQAISDYIQCFF